jgi:hypothetical protein
VGHAPGFSLHPFSVAGPTRPTNAYRCFALPGETEGFLSEFDFSIPGFIRCDPVELPEWELIPLKTITGIVQVFKFVRNFL